MTEQEKNVYQSASQTSNSTILIILKSLTETVRILDLMLKEERIVNQKMADFFTHHPNPVKSDESMRAFGQICDRLWNLETILSCNTRTAMLMAAIDLETTICQFCISNLGAVITDAISPLSLDAQLEVAHRALGIPEEFKDTQQYHALCALMKWRTAFEQGTIPDMPARSIHENALISQNNYPHPGDEVKQLIDSMHHYLVVQQHIMSINEHPYYFRHGSELEQIEQRMNKIREFIFKEGRLSGQMESSSRNET